MIHCTVQMEFSTAKRLVDFEGKCTQLHGYHHVLEASFRLREDENPSLVMDYYAIRAALGTWLDENWDHNVILNTRDRELGEAISKVTGQKVYYTPGDPTAENLAFMFKNEVCPALLGDKLICTRVRLYDNRESFVDVT